MSEKLHDLSFKTKNSTKVDKLGKYICGLIGNDNSEDRKSCDRKIECHSLLKFMILKFFPSLKNKEENRKMIISFFEMCKVGRTMRLKVRRGNEFCDMLTTIHWCITIPSETIWRLLIKLPRAIEECQYYHTLLIITWLQEKGQKQPCFNPWKGWKNRQTGRKQRSGEVSAKIFEGRTYFGKGIYRLQAIENLKKFATVLKQVVCNRLITPLQYVYRWIFFWRVFEEDVATFKTYLDMIDFMREVHIRFDFNREGMMEVFHRGDINALLSFSKETFLNYMGINFLHRIPLLNKVVARLCNKTVSRSRKPEEIFKMLNPQDVLKLEARFVQHHFIDIATVQIEFNKKNCSECEYLVFASDLHVNVMEMMSGDHGHVSNTTYYRALRRVNAIKKILVEDKGIDIKKCGLVILGDLCCFGTQSELQLAKMFYRDCGFGYNFVVPGNHDISVFFGNYSDSKINGRLFANDILGNCNFTYSEEDDKKIYRFEESNGWDPYFPRVCRLSGDHYLVLMDSNHRGHVTGTTHVANGSFGESQVQELRSCLELIKKNKKARVVIGFHHHTWTVSEGLIDYIQNHASGLDQGEFPVVLKDFKDIIIGVVFGHIHKSAKVKDRNKINHYSIGHLGAGESNAPNEEEEEEGEGEDEEKEFNFLVLNVNDIDGCQLKEIDVKYDDSKRDSEREVLKKEHLMMDDSRNSPNLTGPIAFNRDTEFEMSYDSPMGTSSGKLSFSDIQGIHGMLNRNVTCYMVSTLQCFLRTGFFREMFKKYQEREKICSRIVVRMFEIMEEMYDQKESHSHALDPLSFVNLCDSRLDMKPALEIEERKSKKYRLRSNFIGSFQDAAEFIVKLLDSVDMDDEFWRKEIGKGDSCGEAGLFGAMDGFKYKGFYMDKCVCGEEYHCPSVDGIFHYAGLGESKNRKEFKALDVILRSSFVERDCSCSPGKKKMMKRRMVFEKIPDVLLVQIARFQVEENVPTFRSDEVGFSDGIVIRKIDEGRRNETEIEYSLCGVVYFLPKKKHYVSIVKCPIGNEKSQWFFFDDAAFPMPMNMDGIPSMPKVKEEFKGHIEMKNEKNAYILFYEKKKKNKEIDTCSVKKSEEETEDGKIKNYYAAGEIIEWESINNVENYRFLRYRSVFVKFTNINTTIQMEKVKIGEMKQGETEGEISDFRVTYQMKPSMNLSQEDFEEKRIFFSKKLGKYNEDFRIKLFGWDIGDGIFVKIGDGKMRAVKEMVLRDPSYLFLLDKMGRSPLDVARYNSKDPDSRVRQYDDMLMFLEGHMERVKNAKNILVVGGTGTGKSTFLNFLFGRRYKDEVETEVFKEEAGTMRGTETVQSKLMEEEGKTTINFIDTPGLFDERDLENMMNLLKCIKRYGKIHGVIMVFNKLRIPKKNESVSNEVLDSLKYFAELLDPLFKGSERHVILIRSNYSGIQDDINIIRRRRKELEDFVRNGLGVKKLSSIPFVDIICSYLNELKRNATRESIKILNASIKSKKTTVKSLVELKNNSLKDTIMKLTKEIYSKHS